MIPTIDERLASVVRDRCWSSASWTTSSSAPGMAWRTSAASPTITPDSLAWA